MFRTIAFVASGTFALSAVVMAPATARAKAVTGNITCTLTGKAVITPGLPLASPGPAAKTVKTTTTFTGTLSACSTGTASVAIDGGSVTAVAKSKVAKGMDLPSCIGLQAPATATVLKAKVVFTNGGKKVATSKANLTVGNADIAAVVTFTATGLVSGGNGFKGKTATATAVLDKTPADLAGVCNGGASTEFDFSGDLGNSSLEIQ